MPKKFKTIDGKTLILDPNSLLIYRGLKLKFKTCTEFHLPGQGMVKFLGATPDNIFWYSSPNLPPGIVQGCSLQTVLEFAAAA